MRDLLESLNESQRDAVTCTEGPLLVLAGAGSGKTRVLTHRIAYIIQSGKAEPHQVLAITFTNKAAEEMKRRIAQLLGSVGSSMWVSTFHSACARILRRDIDVLGMGRNFTICDADDQQKLVKKVLGDLGLSGSPWTPAGVLATISRAKNNLVGPADFESTASDFYRRQVAKVYREYQRRLLSNNALDFDDLLFCTARLFSDYPEVLARYGRQFKYVLIDEYQDTNHAQYVIASMLCREHRNLCVVGDDDQSIYGWRGADIRNILEFEHEFPEARVIKLEQNYRSTQNILDVAGAVVSNNRGRREKRLWTRRERGEPVRYLAFPDEQEEARFVAAAIRDIYARTARYSDTAVFYRIHAQSRNLEEALSRWQIPYEIVGGVSFFERKEIRDILAYLRLIENPLDDVAAERIINVPARGIGAGTLDRLHAHATKNGLSLMEAVADVDGTDLPARSKQLVRRFADIMTDLIEAKSSHTPSSLIRFVLAQTGYLTALKLEGTEEAESRIENLGELVSMAQELEEREGLTELGEFLGTVSLLTSFDTVRSDADRVLLMTVHSAKGLEFSNVFVVGLNEGLFPHSRSFDNEGEMEEERRLFYVACTRAKEQLYLTSTQYRHFYGTMEQCFRSRFIDEIPGKLLEQPGLARKPGEVKQKERQREPAGRFAVGDLVVHDKFGTGTVVSQKGEGDDLEISVAFKGKGIVRLLARYAPLKKA
ncbi:MAG: UvrD-helicase domain-containing protein [Bacillota bacterium]